MVPSPFSSFFAASAGVAGALIGLLFVAISVAPQWSESGQRVELDVRAGVAFSALIDALVVSLFALIPGVDLGMPALVVAVSGLASCVALGIVLLRSTAVGNRGHHLRLLVAQGIVFVLQGVAALQLIRNPHDQSAVRYLAIVTVIFFIVGIIRAWQLIGAKDSGLLRVVRDALRERSARPVGTAPASPDE
jgi:hypothetical protein